MNSLILVFLCGLIFVNGQYRQLPLQYGQQTDRIPIVKNNYLSDGQGNYEYSYETANGISANEHASQHTLDDKVVRGSYSYIGDDGKTYTVNYYADATGFHAMGDHIPNGIGTGGSHVGTGYNKKQIIYRKPQQIQSQQYQKPQIDRGYNYQKPAVQYLPPKPSTNYLPPHYRY